MAIHLDSIRYDHNESREASYPFSVPVIKNLKTLSFTTSVTIFVGENGSGKSTILEAIASAAGMVAVGTSDVIEDESLTPASNLGKCLTLRWKQRTKKGFFLRAEDFINFARRISGIRREMELELSLLDERMRGSSDYARQLARQPYQRTLAEIKNMYDRDLESFSHGESFFQLFNSRLNPNGLYLLDEPETPLSPTKQLALMMLINEMVSQNCQFIIATHSPMLMAMPHATILNFDESPVQKVSYEDLKHVQLMRDFLNHPEQFIRHL